MSDTGVGVPKEELAFDRIRDCSPVLAKARADWNGYKIKQAGIPPGGRPQIVLCCRSGVGTIWVSK